MKKYLFLAAALLAGTTVFTSCSEDDDDKVELKVLTFEGDAFSALIDSPEYGGKLIYSGDEYKWIDAGTNLSSSCRKDDWGKYGWGWGNGIAISNYVNPNATTYKNQLSVPVSNGSKNFGVVWDNDSKLAFANGSAHVIKSMKVSPTVVSLADMESAKGENFYFKVIVTGTLADNSTKTLDIYLGKGTDIKTEWFNVDMTSLGAVTSLTFTFDGSEKGTYDLSTAKYFAIDDVVVIY